MYSKTFKAKVCPHGINKPTIHGIYTYRIQVCIDAIQCKSNNANQNSADIDYDIVCIRVYTVKMCTYIKYCN